MNYLIYKVINLIYGKFSLIKISPLVSSIGNINFESKYYHFDLSHSTTHLGDRLFFIPLINALIEKSYIVTFDESDAITPVLLKKLYGKSIRHCVDANTKPIVIIPAPSIYAYRNKHPNALVVNFTDKTCRNKISNELLNSISFLSKDDLPVAFEGSRADTHESQIKFSKLPRCYLFSNYIQSGLFRKIFIDESKLNKRAAALHELGFCIVHVGTKHEKIMDTNLYPFVDIDLRGELTIGDLLDLASSSSVLGAVTYDNFLMHLMGLYNKPAAVLFRGRFLLSNRLHHYRYVNNTFFASDSRITYI